MEWLSALHPVSGSRWASTGFFAALLLVGGLQTPARAQTVYTVDAVAGNDANDGSAAAPWKTIRKAFETVSSAATIEIRQGVYAEGSLYSYSNGVTVRGIGKVVLRSTLLDAMNQSYWRFENLCFKYGGISRAYSAAVVGCRFEDATLGATGGGMVFRYCEFIRCGRGADLGTNSAVENCTFAGNRIGVLVTGDNVKVWNSVFYKNPDSAIILANANPLNFTESFNAFFQNGAVSGFSLTTLADIVAGRGRYGPPPVGTPVTPHATDLRGVDPRFCRS